MPVSVTCPQCRAHYDVVDQLSGKRVHCQECRAVIQVPEARWEQIVAEEAADQAVPPPVPDLIGNRPLVLPPNARPPRGVPHSRQLPRLVKPPKAQDNNTGGRVAGAIVGVIVIAISVGLRSSNRSTRYEPIKIPRPQPVFQQPIFVPAPEINPNPMARPGGFPGNQPNPWDPNPVVPGWNPNQGRGWNPNGNPVAEPPRNPFDPNPAPWRNPNQGPGRGRNFGGGFGGP
jgi:hypothetical protein